MDLPALMNRNDLKVYFGKSFAITDQMIALPCFPDPVLVNGKGRYWAKAAVDHFLTHFGQKIKPVFDIEREAERILNQGTQ